MISNRDLLLSSLISIISYVAFLQHSFLLSIICFAIILYSFMKGTKVIVGLVLASSIIDFSWLSFGIVQISISQIISLLAFLFWLVKGSHRIEKKSVIFCLTMTVSAILSYIGGFSDVGIIISWIINIAIYLIVLDFCRDTEVIKYGLKFAMVFCFVSIVLISFSLLTNPVMPNESFVGRYSISPEINVNTLAKIVAISGTLVVFSLFKERGIINKSILIICIVCSCYSIFITGSRTSLIAFIIGILIAFIFSGYGNSTIRRVLISMVIFLILLPFVVEIIDNTRYSFEAIIADGGSSRFDSYPIIIYNIIPKYWLTGVGIGGQYNVLSSTGYNYVAPAHNFVISCIAELGIIIGIYFIVNALRIEFKAYKNARYDELMFIIFGVFFVVLVIGLGETIFSERCTFMLLAIISARLISLNCSTENSKKSIR